MEGDEICLNFSSDDATKDWPHEWTRKPDCDEFVGSKRSKHTLVAYRGALYAFGGDNGQRMLNDLLCYNVSETTWSRACTTGQIPAPRYHHSSVVHGNSMFIFGGYTGDIHLNCNLQNRNDLYEYNFLTCAWSEWKFQPNSVRPVPRSAHGAAAYDGRMWIYGGYDGNNRLNDMWTIPLNDPSGTFSKWTEVDQGGDRPPTCCNFALSVARGCMYVFSGQSGTRVTNDLFEFNFRNKIWTRISIIDNILRGVGTPPSRRYGHTMVHHGRHLYVFGGAVDSTLPNDVYTFDLDSRGWSVVPPTSGSEIPSERLFHAAAVHSDAMYIYGGTMDKKDRTNQVYRFQFISHPPCTLRKDFGRLLLDSVCQPDLIFILNRQNAGRATFSAHRSIVCARSSQLMRQVCRMLDEKKRLFKALSSDSKVQLDPMDPLEIVLSENTNPDAFDLVLKFMYTDEIDWSNVTNDPLSNLLVLIMMDVYRLSLQFNLIKLTTLCESYLNTAITTSNVLTVLSQASILDLHSIKEVCLKFIIKESNYQAVIMSGQFESLPQPLMVEIVRRKHQPHIQDQHHQLVPAGPPPPAAQRSISYNEYNAEGSLERDLELFLQSEHSALLSDIILTLDSQHSIKVESHRAILAARSSYFEALFRSWVPADQIVQISIIELVPPKNTFDVLLRYLYAGKTDCLSAEDSIYLLRAASFYGLTNGQLTSWCKWHLEHNIHIGVLVQVLRAADQICHLENQTIVAENIKRHCLDKIVKNFNSVTQLEPFRNLPRHLLLEIIDSVASKWTPPASASLTPTGHTQPTLSSGHSSQQQLASLSISPSTPQRRRSNSSRELLLAPLSIGFSPNGSVAGSNGNLNNHHRPPATISAPTLPPPPAPQPPGQDGNGNSNGAAGSGPASASHIEIVRKL